ncbi:TrkH family potassium uptake protein [Hoylesella marshii]|uniref:Potassium uptake protein, TrkH family n=1 Tax=Hoylesella marshii DSM 16973 = JCM 13450 TaxID=862515 RepID=E0NT89_9BACT|nr:TrkH family potassium uptake protein [Hoylesella marshii]EFM01661.1 potassium uptake protein, TrkH family [Hoylesella marshii DSM 16973 = JCM 13450]
MINLKLISKILGSLLFLEAGLMLMCLLMASYFKEDDVMAFLISVIVTLLFGFVLKYAGGHADNALGRRDAYLVVTLSWTVFSLFGTLPFLISGYITGFTDAFFETMSGFTTTGATILDDVEAFPHGLLFWRSLTQWLGGLGIVFFTIALLPSMVGGSVRVFAAEATGPISSKLHPKLSTSAKWIWMVYLLLTVACIGSYVACGMGWFDGINYAMSTTATGGFSTHNTSVEYFHSPAVEYVCTLFCFLSGINFTLFYASVVKLRPKQLLTNSEFRFYLVVVLSLTVFIMIELMIQNGYDLEHAFRCGLFQVVSFLTTTGIFNDDAGQWPHVTWVALALCMFIGACSGSTSGGFKSIRGVMLLKIIKNEFKHILHPNAVLPVRINGVNIENNRRLTLLSFLTMYLVLSLVCSFTMIACGIDNTNAITITLSALGNVGPSLGLEIGPTMSWNSLPDFAKWMCSFLMLVGRLEIFSVLVIFTPAFWKNN